MTETVANSENLPGLTLIQARVLLVSLEPQLIAEVVACLDERGHLIGLGKVKKQLDRLVLLKLVEVQSSKGKQGKRYQLGSGPKIEVASGRTYVLSGVIRAL